MESLEELVKSIEELEKSLDDKYYLSLEDWSQLAKQLNL